jgi:hypothetical protein
MVSGIRHRSDSKFRFTIGHAQQLASDVAKVKTPKLPCKLHVGDARNSGAFATLVYFERKTKIVANTIHLCVEPVDGALFRESGVMSALGCSASGSLGEQKGIVGEYR